MKAAHPPLYNYHIQAQNAATFEKTYRVYLEFTDGKTERMVRAKDVLAARILAIIDARMAGATPQYQGKLLSARVEVFASPVAD